MSRLAILRLGHRPERDKRVTTHCALVGRAFGADSMFFTGDSDRSLIERLGKVSENWGGKFHVSHEPAWEPFVRRWKREGGIVVHCTMYGERLQDIVKTLRNERRKKDLLLVVGGEKVPGKVYQLADYNVAVTGQPHSEIAALALVLDRLYEGAELSVEHPDAKLKIIPQKKGKKLVVVRGS